MNSSSPLFDPVKYRSLVGSLQYLLITKPDIAFALNKLSQHMQRPTTEHWAFVKRLLRYLSGTNDDGLHIFRNSYLSLYAFSDADWARDKDDFSSTGAYVIYLG